MGACLGQEALIATVVRVSLRYRRLAQLEEGYGITMAPVEKLARDVYGDDPAERFACKGEGLRDPLLMARMQKAMAILQFKLEGQLPRRPEWELEHRALLHRIDPAAGTVTIDGKGHPLLDPRFPPRLGDPYALSADEERVHGALTESFLDEPARCGSRCRSSSARLDVAAPRSGAIFHGCVPVDDAASSLAFAVDGEPRRGRRSSTRSSAWCAARSASAAAGRRPALVPVDRPAARRSSARTGWPPSRATSSPTRPPTRRRRTRTST